VRGRSQRGVKSRAQLIECQSALREVLTHGRGRRIPVSIASAHIGCWCLIILPGCPGQLPQHRGVAIRRGPVVAGEGDGGLCSTADPVRGQLPPVFPVRTYPAWSSSRKQMIRLPGGILIMSCSRVTDSVSPPGSAAGIATTRNRAGWWISGSSATVVMVGLPHLQADEQVAQRLGLDAECLAAVAGDSDRSDGRSRCWPSYC